MILLRCDLPLWITFTLWPSFDTHFEDSSLSLSLSSLVFGSSRPSLSSFFSVSADDCSSTQPTQLKLQQRGCFHEGSGVVLRNSRWVRALLDSAPLLLQRLSSCRRRCRWTVPVGKKNTKIYTKNHCGGEQVALINLFTTENIGKTCKKRENR